jgi:squalene monooxygenase
MDVVVIGAGAVGCVTALAYARRGAQVLLLEAHPGAATRLAGEWIHPAGVRILDALGVGGLADRHPAGRGFAIFSADDSDPVRLEYPGDAAALTCDHALLVAALREAAAAHPYVSYMPFAHPTALEGQRLTIERAGRAAQTVLAGSIVGADGRSAVSRKWLRLRDDRVALSCTAGVLLEDAELPHEGFGHLVLSGPGPAFIYRIGPRHLRACLDVPSGLPRAGEHARHLWDAYAPVLPEPLRPAFRHALATRPITWAANYFRARAAYGRPGLALVGDAVGHFHPMTAVGLTLGFQDGETLARSESFEAYRRERMALSHVPEIMAMVLYEVFAARDGGARELRAATFRMLRDAAARERTLGLLAAEDPGVLSFSRAFLTAAAMTTARVIYDVVSAHRLPHGMRVLLYLHRRLTWIAMQALIGVLRPSNGPGTRQLSAMLSGVARMAGPVAAARRVQPVLVEIAPGSRGQKRAS